MKNRQKKKRIATWKFEDSRRAPKAPYKLFSISFWIDSISIVRKRVFFNPSNLIKYQYYIDPALTSVLADIKAIKKLRIDFASTGALKSPRYESRYEWRERKSNQQEVKILFVPFTSSLLLKCCGKRKMLFKRHYFLWIILWNKWDRTEAF